MKKVLFFVFVLFVGFLLAGSRYFYVPVSAQTDSKEFGGDYSSAEQRAQERELAATIKRLTNRSFDGLIEKPVRGGGFLIDMQERFQNVMLARIGESGDAVSACVTSLEEANDFFGKNLETGEPIYTNTFKKDNTAEIAAQHGMSSDEFNFYRKMIADWETTQSPSSPATAATITIVNGDTAAPAEGFYDTTVVSPVGGNPGTTLGAQRLNLFQKAADIWSANLSSTIPIKVFSKFDPLTCTTNSATLGSAGAAFTIHSFSGAEFTNTTYHLALANKRANSDFGSPALNQINATFNSNLGNVGCLDGNTFYYGYDNAIHANQVNLLVVLLHELGHGLGFSSFVTTLNITGATNATPIVITTSAAHNLVNGDVVTIQNATGNTAANGTWTISGASGTTFTLVGSAGNGAYGANGIIRGVNSGGRPDIWSRLMYDRTTGKTWLNMTTAERSASILNTGNVMWDGANVKIASGFMTAGRDAATGRVQMFTPNPFQQGSSVSHFDTAAVPNQVMEPVINDLLPIDFTNDLTPQLLRDIGWYRDSDAVVGADTITLVSPNSGSVHTGSPTTINWTNNGGFSRNVTIEYSTDGGTTYSTVASNIANTGSYTWTVPNTTTTLGRIRVREANFADPSAVSSSNFSVTTAPTAAMVYVGGRVLDARGKGISGARVTVLNSNGETIYALTNPFGYFYFKEIESGATYIFQATHKRYTFAPRVVNLTEDLNGLNFTAQQ